VLVPIGKILGTHGLKGEVKFSPFSLDFDFLFAIQRFYLSKKGDRFFEVESLRQGPGFNVFLIKFKGVNYEEAQSLKNLILYIDTKDLPQPEEGEFYYYQVLGALVIDEKSGKIWGKVKEIMPVGEYDLFLVESDSGSFYIPLVEEFVKDINLLEKKILVRSIEDLFKVQVSKNEV